MSNWLILCVIGFVVLDIFLISILFKIFFKRKGSFKEVIYFAFKPILLSIIDKEFWDRIDAETKSKFFLGCCLGIVLIEVIVLENLWTVI